MTEVDLNTLKLATDNQLDLYMLYYKRLFPSSQIYRWLSYGTAETFAKREIAFQLSDNSYIRYQSYDTVEDFVKKLLKLINESFQVNPKSCLIKIDIGAMYYPNPNEVLSNLTAIAKELVFDIDMSDYDDIRTCCSGANICSKCWKFIVMASKIIDKALRNDFGFNHILWVFSGRRGIHGWICDERAKSLEAEARSAIAHYLQIISGGRTTFIHEKVSLPGNIHPSIKRALLIIDNYFIEYIVKEQDILGAEEKLKKFLELIDESVRSAFHHNMSKATSSIQRWEAFEQTWAKLQEEGKMPTKFKYLKEQMKLYFSYPRLDVPVTQGLEHLLKAPFCTHPKTGKICIPIDINSIDDFDPNNVPTIEMVVQEIQEYDKKAEKRETELNGGTTVNKLEAAEIKDIKQTSLLGPVSLFMEFLENMEKARNQ